VKITLDHALPIPSPYPSYLRRCQTPFSVQCIILRAKTAAQPSVGRSQAVARRHRDDARDQNRFRGARHRHPRPSGDRPQGARELQEPGVARV